MHGAGLPGSQPPPAPCTAHQFAALEWGRRGLQEGPTLQWLHRALTGGPVPTPTYLHGVPVTPERPAPPVSRVCPGSRRLLDSRGREALR